jgi:NADPH-dependent 2,4-dienoyl-CoA reductase/sulfur reductase-like enzyme
MAGRTVTVLGGGVGGLVTANELRRRLDRRDRVVVVERSRRYLFQPSLLWLMVGRRRRERIERPLPELLRAGVELVEAEVLGIDPEARRVETSTGELEGDALVVALGAEADPDAVPGFREAALDHFSAVGAAAVARSLAAFRGGRVVVVVSGLPYKCPAAPYEAALLLDDELRRRGLRDASSVDVYTPEPADARGGAGHGRRGGRAPWGEGYRLPPGQPGRAVRAGRGGDRVRRRLTRRLRLARRDRAAPCTHGGAGIAPRERGRLDPCWRKA